MLKSNIIPMDLPHHFEYTYTQLIQELEKAVAYAKSKAFSGNAKISETFTIAVENLPNANSDSQNQVGNFFQLIYQAEEQMKTGLGTRKVCLEYALNQDNITDFCMKTILARNKVEEKDFFRYRVNNVILHQCTNQPQEDKLFISGLIEKFR